MSFSNFLIKIGLVSNVFYLVYVRSLRRGFHVFWGIIKNPKPSIQSCICKVIRLHEHELTF